MNVLKEYFNKNWTSKMLGIFVHGIILMISFSRDLLIAEHIDQKEIVLIVVTFLLIMIIFDWIERRYTFFKINKKHYPRSFNVVKNDILPAFIDRSKSKLCIRENNNRDKIIKSPIDYTKETLSGNVAPIFRPNEKYLEEIFDDDITHIVAITSENPNMWLDPTLSFYLVNCCAVSLIRKFNNNGASKLKICDFDDDDGYKDFVALEANQLLENLKQRKNTTSFEFIRFLIFTEEQKKCLKNTIFPSIKASQDLFRINSFFLQKDQIENSLAAEYATYLRFITEIWERIKNYHTIEDDESLNVIKKREDEHIAEFLILFKNENKVIIHTYINGKAYQTPLDENGGGVINDYEAVQHLIAYLAECRLKKGQCDWTPKNVNNVLNSTKSYIDWE